MYRLMIVEDEPIVLDGMLKIIDFSDLGFEVVAACANGKIAYDSFYDARPDVVITDICMEIMDGLEFIESVRSDNPETKFIIISGHQDFKFFKKALSLKVTDYILKPVTAKEFRELLTKVANDLDERKRLNEELDKKKKNADGPFQMQKNFFLNELVSLKLDENEILANLDKYNIGFDMGCYQVLIFEMQDLPTASKLLEFKSSGQLLRDIKFELDKVSVPFGSVITFINPQGRIIAIVNSKNHDDLKSSSTDLGGRIYKHFGNDQCTLINCFAGYFVDSLLDVSRSYKSARKMNLSGVFKNSTGLYDANDILINRKKKTYNHLYDMDEWTRNIIYGEKRAVSDLEYIIRKIENAGYLLSDYKTIANEMVETLGRELDVINANYIDSTTNIEMFTEGELSRYLMTVTKTGIQQINKGSNGKEAYIADKAIRYIEDNFNDTGLSLQQICKYLNISVSYFSSVFKAHTKMTFVKYLNNFRTEKAKYFLEFSQKTIGEISEMVGYIEPHYFGIVFKKYSGQTPKKYRAMVRKPI